MREIKDWLAENWDNIHLASYVILGVVILMDFYWSHTWLAILNFLAIVGYLYILYKSIQSMQNKDNIKEIRKSVEKRLDRIENNLEGLNEKLTEDYWNK